MSNPQKKPKLSHSDNQYCNQHRPSNDQWRRRSKIFKLNIDCLDEIFEYLDVRDLLSFGQTCNRMNKVAGEYFKQNYLSAEKQCEIQGIYFSFYMDYWDKNYSKKCYVEKNIELFGFNKFIQCIPYNHYNDSLRYLEYIEEHIKEFQSINHIYLQEIDENFAGYKNKRHFKQLLPKLEILQHRHCSMVGDFYDLVLKYCENLREIYIQDSDVGKRINGKLNWLLQVYPKLERLELKPRDSNKFEELREFFVRNPNVQRFSIFSTFLWDNEDILLNSNAKLDILEVKNFNSFEIHSSYGNRTSKSLLELLNRLHEQGFYKRLYIYVESVCERFSTLLASLNGLKLLCIGWLDKSYNLAELTNLRELIILGGSNTVDMEILANGLTNLERLYIDRASIDDIMPFIRRSPNLNKIKFIPRDKGVVLNLVMLNAERVKLAEARKVTIYTRDDVFLATKWTIRNCDTDLSSIEMRRKDSIKWNDYYNY